MKPNFYLFAVYAKVYNEFAGPISASRRLGNTALFEEMLQQRQAVGNTASI